MSSISGNKSWQALGKTCGIKINRVGRQVYSMLCAGKRLWWGSYRFMGRGNWPGPDRRPSLHSCLMIIKCNSFFFCKCSFISSNMRVLKSPSVCHELISIVLAFSLLWRKIFNVAPELGLLDITWLLMIIQKQNDPSPIIISFS